mmetsp:Transcript_22652/g.53551  ORF Transcript_22652/g.53551 Transcript_22652/m.53551 type:complete len:247 (-) Transcript_22652:373-1113(-)
MATRLVWLVALVGLVCVQAIPEGCPAGISIPEYGNCTGGHTGCCEPGLVCYKQDDAYAQCREPGSCPCSSWDCTELQQPCSGRVPRYGNCRQSGCCDEGLVCYEQDDGYAQCLPEGACPGCSSAWTCNVVRPGAFISSGPASLLNADGQMKQEEASSTRKSESWKKIVGGVTGGLGALALVAVLALCIARQRSTIPSAMPPNIPGLRYMKSEIVHAAGADGFDVDTGVKQRLGESPGSDLNRSAGS